ncbi:MAG: DUF3899 domain-containing protein [Enterococcus sp.]
MKKRLSPYLIGSVVLVLIVSIDAIKQQLTLLTLSNHFFIVGIPFLIIGGFLWVFSSGFFDHFQRSMHLSLKRNQKKEPSFLPLSSVGASHFSFWLIIAALLIGSSIVLALLSML